MHAPERPRSCGPRAAGGASSPEAVVCASSAGDAGGDRRQRRGQIDAAPTYRRAARPAEEPIALDPGAGGRDRRRRVHYLGHLDALKPALTVRENLLFWQSLWQGAGDIDDALDTVGIGGLDHLHVSSLSAGQKRRVALARLLLHARPVWLLDEPATSLDASGEAMLGRLVDRHLAGGGMAMAALHRPLPVAPTQSIALGRPA